MSDPAAASPSPRSPVSGVHRAVTDPGSVPKPLLASELIQQDLAPSTPGHASARRWFVGVAILLSLLGLALRWGAGVPQQRLSSASLSFLAAAATALLALLPLSYRGRALLAMALGSSLLLLGSSSAGPLAGVAVDGGLLRHASRFLALTCLTAALLFRARYRHYARGARLLAWALLLSLPFIATELRLPFDPTAPTAVRWGAGLSLTVIAAAGLGLIRHQAPWGNSLLAVLVLGVLPLEVALRQWTPLADPATGRLTYVTTALALLGAGVLTSTGGYHLLASIFCSDAQRCASATPRAP